MMNHFVPVFPIDKSHRVHVYRYMFFTYIIICLCVYMCTLLICIGHYLISQIRLQKNYLTAITARFSTINNTHHTYTNKL